MSALRMLWLLCAASASSAQVVDLHVAATRVSLEAKVPALPLAPRLEVTLRARQDAPASAEVQLAQPLGPLVAFGGTTSPVANASRDPWRSRFAGIAWRGAAHRSIELSLEDWRDVSTGERDREATLRLAQRDGAHARWSFALTRRLDDPADRWQSRVGLDWRF